MSVYGFSLVFSCTLFTCFSVWVFWIFRVLSIVFWVRFFLFTWYKIHTYCTLIRQFFQYEKSHQFLSVEYYLLLISYTLYLRIWFYLKSEEQRLLFWSNCDNDSNSILEIFICQNILYISVFTLLKSQRFTTWYKNYSFAPDHGYNLWRRWSWGPVAVALSLQEINSITLSDSLKLVICIKFISVVWIPSLCRQYW